MTGTNRCEPLPRLRAVVVAWAIAGVLLSACATAEGRGDVDAGVAPPFVPDANLADAPYGATLYLRGTFNGFGTSSPLAYQGNNRYTAVVSLGAGSHALRIADEAYDPDTTFSVAADRPAAIALDTPTALVPAAGSGNEMQLVVPDTGTYRFELSATDRTSPVLLISLVSRAPYRNLLYVRGSFNGFDTSVPLVYQGSNRYLATVGLDAGAHAFKIADETFSAETTFAVRADATETLALDTPTPLVPAPDLAVNTTIDLPEAGSWAFELIASNIEAPVLLVSLVETAPYRVPIYLRGSFNGFDTSVPMRYLGADRYVATIGLDDGTHGFKIADLDFTAEHTFSVDATQPAAIALDRPTVLVASPGQSGEITFDAAATGSFAFELTATDPRAPVLLVRRVAPAPYPVALFVRGSFNDFEPVDRLRYQGENRYVATLALAEGQHQLKIADAAFSEQTTFSVDASGAASIELDTPTVLVRAAGTNNDTVLSISQAGDYRFDLAADNPVAPVLRISRDIAQ